MTDEEINIAIAEVCGWKDLENEDFSKYGVPCFMLMGYNDTGTRLMPPDYCNDLNAMHEAENVMTEEQMAIYAYEIDKAFPPEQQDKIWFSRAYCFVHATARQRAEAFLRTLGKWEEA